MTFSAGLSGSERFAKKLTKGLLVLRTAFVHCLDLVGPSGSARAREHVACFPNAAAERGPVSDLVGQRLLGAHLPGNESEKRYIPSPHWMDWAAGHTRRS